MMMARACKRNDTTGNGRGCPRSSWINFFEACSLATPFPLQIFSELDHFSLQNIFLRQIEFFSAPYSWVTSSLKTSFASINLLQTTFIWCMITFFFMKIVFRFSANFLKLKFSSLQIPIRNMTYDSQLSFECESLEFALISKYLNVFCPFVWFGLTKLTCSVRLTLCDIFFLQFLNSQLNLNRNECFIKTWDVRCTLQQFTR